MSISLSVNHHFGNFLLDVAFESSGKLTAIFGASGSGKTSLVNVIAGLVKPQHAKIVTNGLVLADSSQGICLPPQRRRVGYVFQDARLFPHMSVEQNLKYGQWFRPGHERYADQGQILALLGIGHLLHRRPSQLSGGEKQRVAIGRALLASPKLLLMDEPLASLDHARKQEILPYIERLRDEFAIPIIYVSHSVAEVARLATDILVLAAGKAAAFGPAALVMQRIDLLPDEERDEGGVILEMRVSSYDTEFGMTTLRSEAGDVHVPGFVGNTGEPARVRIRARDVMLATERPGKLSALNILRGRLTSMVEQDRSSTNITVDCSGTNLIARVTRQSVSALGLEVGQNVFTVVKAVSVVTPAPISHSQKQ